MCMRVWRRLLWWDRRKIEAPVAVERRRGRHGTQLADIETETKRLRRQLELIQSRVFAAEQQHQQTPNGHS